MTLIIKKYNHKAVTFIVDLDEFQWREWVNEHLCKNHFPMTILLAYVGASKSCYSNNQPQQYSINREDE